MYFVMFKKLSSRLYTKLHFLCGLPNHSIVASVVVELLSRHLRSFSISYRRDECLKLRSESVVLGILPIFHVFGTGMCLATLIHGATLVTLPRFIPNLFLNAIQTYKASMVSFPYLLYDNFNHIGNQFSLVSDILLIFL